MENPRKKFKLEYSYFSNKRILIVGAGSIGQACAKFLLKSNSKVVLVYRKLQGTEAIQRQYPTQLLCIECDLAVDADQFSMVKRAIEFLEILDILINAAGIIVENDLESTLPRDHDHLIDINLRSVFYISQLCAPYLCESQGCIVNLSSLARPQQGMVSYCMSKSGLNMLTKSLAFELSPVRVNAVAPNLIDNNFLASSRLSDQEIKRIKSSVSEKNPLKRLAKIEDIVNAIVFLCSPKSSKITGQIINVDGGLNVTSSSFVNWDLSWKMNSKFLPDGLKTINKITSWFGQLADKIMDPGLNNPASIRFLQKRSNWFTNLADAHIKVHNNYDQVEEEEDALGILENLKADDSSFLEAKKMMRSSFNIDSVNFGLEKD
jgi:NAD(P)-dependent dehydrogenase (short-subunit alcohol dehydrogenase family)